MGRLQPGMMLASLAAAALLAAAGWAQAPGTLSAKLDPSGVVRLMRGDAELANVELSAHGPQWKHAPQATATAEVAASPDQAGKRLVGTLPVPGAGEGAIRFTETVDPLPQGLRLEYDLTMTGPLKLNGLQVSVNLPVAQYGGKELTIPQPDDEPQGVGLPTEQKGETFQIWTGEGAKIEVAKGTEDALTIELRAPTDLIVQDLRRWEHPTFEIRFPAIMEEGGRDVTADDRFHLDLTVTMAAPVRLEGP